MQLWNVTLESHCAAATLYVTGMFSDSASVRSAELIWSVHEDARVIRVDMRPVEFIEPAAFLRLARSLNAWRDLRGGDVAIRFPDKSTRRRPATAPRLTLHGGIFDTPAAHAALR
jgi:hypothetical protein